MVETHSIGSVELRTISTQKEIGKFIDFRTELYKDDPCAVPFLFMDERDTLSREKNPSFEFCEAEYYMAYRDGKPVGRVAAIINHKANEKWGQKNVRFGFFDFIEDREVSKALIDAVRDYGIKKGMNTIIGPMGFTDMDKEGLLVEGYDTLGSMHANHNYPYYKEHLEALGFTKDNDWVQLLITVPDRVPEKMARVAKMIGTRYNLHVVKLTKKELQEEGYGRTFFHVLNECYKDLYEYSELAEQQIDKLVKEYLAIADLNIVSFVFDQNVIDNENPHGKMVGFGVSFPSFSHAMRKTGNGKLLPFGWIHLLRTLFFHNTETVDLMLVGVLPEYRAKGANALIFDDLIHWYIKYNFKNALTLSMMETNDGVLGQWDYFESKVVKRLRSYKASL